ncbi:MAG: VOC family protein [Micromonosporaceae bacterium]
MKRVASRDHKEPSGPAIGPILDAAVVVHDLDAATARYRDGFGWTVAAAGDSGPGGAAPWWTARVRTALVGPRTPSGVPGAVRLVECPEAIAPDPLRWYGWTAIELCVRDVDSAIDRALDHDWTLLRAPDRLGAGTLPLVAGQIAGPDGEAVYLTQRLADVPGFDLPEPRQDVDGVFIAVLGARDLEASREALESRYEVRRASDRRSPIGVVNLTYGLPEGTTHRLSTLQLAGRTCIEIDQLPPGATSRPTSPGGRCGRAGVAPPGGADVATRGEPATPGEPAAPVGGVVAVTVAARVAAPELIELPDGAQLWLRPESPNSWDTS